MEVKTTCFLKDCFQRIGCSLDISALIFHLYFSPVYNSEYLGLTDGLHLRKNKNKYSRVKMLLKPHKNLSPSGGNLYENTSFSRKALVLDIGKSI